MNSAVNASKMGYFDISIYHVWLKCLPIWDIDESRRPKIL